ncbi:MAG TPA: HutD family protein [Steroidobacteraceae bacterium]|nr:HutD family protein [Steroidobacteraceae bacterium]
MTDRLSVLPAAAHRRMRWRNGRGSTTELLVSPAGASLESFDFRLSMAQLEGPAPFSTFSGVDRLLLMLEGHVRLEIEGTSGICCAPEQEAIGFGGEQAVTATPIESGPAVMDLNLMIRRGRYRGALQQLSTATCTAWRASATVSALLCRHGSVTFEAEKASVGEHGRRYQLHHDDLLLIEGQLSDALAVTAQPDTRMYLAELFRL